jgi:glutamate racemase
MFVPLAEEGWVEGEVPRRIAEAYLEEFRKHGVDSLLLGCTHYPLLASVIAHVMGPDVAIVDSAEATADSVADLINGLANANASSEGKGQLTCLVSDSPKRFTETGRAFLGEAIGEVSWVDV